VSGVQEDEAYVLNEHVGKASECCQEAMRASDNISRTQRRGALQMRDGDRTGQESGEEESKKVKIFLIDVM
jgi:hypothetical protein